jgi:hypothetical protein
MKLPISQTTYQKLIQELFEEIYIEIEKSAIKNGGILFYEVDSDEAIFYPNFEKLSNGRIETPDFDLFEYETSYDKLRDFLIRRLDSKYNTEKYQVFKKNVADWAIMNNCGEGSDFDQILDHRLFYKSKFIQISKENPKNDYLYNKALIDSYYKEDVRYYISEAKGNFPSSFQSSLDDYDYSNVRYSSFCISNFVIIDLLYFVDKNIEKQNERLNGSAFGYLLKMNDVNSKNPFINIISDWFSSDSKNELTERKFVELINKFYDAIQLETSHQIAPSLKTNKRVADLFCKAVILVLNNRLPNRDEFEVKIDALYEYDDKNKSRRTRLTSTNYKQLDNIFNSYKTSLDGLRAKNLATLFHLLRKKREIHEMNNSELGLIVRLLTGKSDARVSRCLGEIKDVDSFKLVKYEKHKDHLITLLEELLEDLR